MRSKTHSKQAVSEVLDIVILLGITLALFGVLNYIVFSFSFQPAAPSVNLVGSINKTTKIITIEHNGGESLDGNANIIVIINNNSPDQKRISDLINETNNDSWNFKKINNDYKWNLGETVEYSYGNISDLIVHVSVVDLNTNTLILSLNQ